MPLKDFFKKDKKEINGVIDKLDTLLNMPYETHRATSKTLGKITDITSKLCKDYGFGYRVGSSMEGNVVFLRVMINSKDELVYRKTKKIKVTNDWWG